jgi:formylmethanofuran--tetrahydromethanopterin N-formyltransferase
MDGEFLCEDTVGQQKAVGGGNFLILGRARAAVLASAERAIAAMRKLSGVIMPFPGGVVRSGSKIGSRYKGLTASSNLAYCPTVKGTVETALPPEISAVLEIVIDGLTDTAVGQAMAVGIRAACANSAGEIVRISAGNYGGKLGAFQFHLHKLVA